jgi:hypothetical protein
VILAHIQKRISAFPFVHKYRKDMRNNEYASPLIKDKLVYVLKMYNNEMNSNTRENKLKINGICEP